MILCRLRIGGWYWLHMVVIVLCVMAGLIMYVCASLAAGLLLCSPSSLNFGLRARPAAQRERQPTLSLLGMIWPLHTAHPTFKTSAYPSGVNTTVTATDIPRGTSTYFAQNALTQI